MRHDGKKMIYIRILHSQLYTAKNSKKEKYCRWTISWSLCGNFVMYIVRHVVFFFSINISFMFVCTCVRTLLIIPASLQEMSANYISWMKYFTIQVLYIKNGLHISLPHFHESEWKPDSIIFRMSKQYIGGTMRSCETLTKSRTRLVLVLCNFRPFVMLHL